MLKEAGEVEQREALRERNPIPLLRRMLKPRALPDRSELLLDLHMYLMVSNLHYLAYSGT